MEWSTLTDNHRYSLSEVDYLYNYFCIQELGLIRKPASFMTSICDERGQELLYAGIPITDIFKEDMGIGGVLSLLWFQRR